MSGVYFNADVSLKTYSALTKSGKTLIKIELETLDHFAAASILRQLDEIESEKITQDKAAKAAKAEARKPKKAPLALPAPQLRLPHYPEGE